MEVSLDFERFQEDSILWSWFTDSGFSAEDLTSNLIGFYRAVEGYKMGFYPENVRPNIEKSGI